MSKGFKKSLFGFNCEEVVAYIEKAHKTFKEKELLLNEKIDFEDTEKIKGERWWKSQTGQPTSEDSEFS